MGTMQKKLLRCKEEWERFKDERKQVHHERLCAETNEHEPVTYPAVVVFEYDWFESADGIRLNTCSYLFVYRDNFIKTKLDDDEL